MSIGRWNNAVPLSEQFFPIQPNIQFYTQNGQIVWADASGVNNVRKLFETCAPLSAIILRMAEAFSTGKLEVLNARSGNYVRGRYKEWEMLLDNPNPLQSRAQFMMQLYMYMKLNGYCYGLKMYPEGLEDRPTKLWILPPWCVEVDPIDKPFYNVTREDRLNNVYFIANGKRARLNSKYLMLFTDNTNDFDVTTWLPKSRVLLNQYPISTLLSSVEAEITMIQRKGALGILSNTSNDTIGLQPLNPEDKRQLQEDYSRYGLSRGQYQVIITNASLQWQSMTFPTRDLMLHESYVKAVKDLCDGFGYYFELLAHSDRKNLSNVQSFDRMLYQNTIVPQADDIAEQLNRNIGTTDENIKIQFDYSHVPALQQSEKDKGEGRYQLNRALKMEWDAGTITRNMWLERLGEDTVNRDEFNRYKWELTPEQLGVLNIGGNENANNETETEESGDGGNQSGN